MTTCVARDSRSICSLQPRQAIAALRQRTAGPSNRLGSAPMLSVAATFVNDARCSNPAFAAFKVDDLAALG